MNAFYVANSLEITCSNNSNSKQLNNCLKQCLVISIIFKNIALNSLAFKLTDFSRQGIFFL